jgi:ketopantoate reductase
LSTTGENRIAVVVPGAIGSTIPARLHQNGHALLLCDRK